MNKILVIGASGFVGRNLAKAFLAQGDAIRALSRTPMRIEDLACAGCEIVHGDISDRSSVLRAVESVNAVYVSLHTLSPQVTSAARPRFMAIEKTGLQTVMDACRLHGVRRVVYVTSLGTSPKAPSEWLRERWEAEQLLLTSGLDVTIIRPGMIVGMGGRGFDTTVGNAKRRIAITISGDRPKMRTIAIDDLIYYLCGMLDDPRAHGRCYDVGCDDVLSNKELIDTIADLLGRRHPIKIQIPLALLRAASPIIERMGNLPRGAMTGLVDSLKVDLDGDPMPIRAILPRPLLSFRRAAESALADPVLDSK